MQETVQKRSSRSLENGECSVLKGLEAAYPRNSCLHDLIEAQAKRTPRATAVTFGNDSLTYAELDARANQLAWLLKTRGVGPEVAVAICLDRSLEMIVALLGTLKAGGAYVPLDPSHPSERIKYVVGDAGAKVLITQEHLLNLVSEFTSEPICLEPQWNALAHRPAQAPPTTSEPGNLAYVIYTSGSTGKPKGVQVEHRSVVNFLLSMQQEPGYAADDVLLAVTTLSFDIAGLEIYLPLLSGGRVVIADRAATYDGRLLMELLRRSKATIMQATPGTWTLLFESGWRGDRKLKVLVGGEALPPALARQLVQSCKQVWNMYGPTETTIWSSVYRVSGQEERLVPIGKPIANTSFYVLDIQGEAVPPGTEGELYIGGDGVARGYLGRPELTREKFLPDPFCDANDGRMYRTGDLARCSKDGNVEYLGRIDHQVKVRGFRIELGEIEAVLAQHSAVRQSIVAASQQASGSTILVAYVIARPGVTLDRPQLRSHLAAQLPDYMIPSAFVELEALPLTPNGKIDRKALPRPKAEDFIGTTEYVAPRDAVERKLASLWEEVLGISPIGATANFFELGGRSLVAARLFARISEVFGKDLPLAVLFSAPTVERLADELRSKSNAPVYPTVVAIRSSGSEPPFFCVHGGAGSTLFLHRLARQMSPEQPFYGIEPEGLDGGPFRRRTIEQMAAHYISEIRKIQPRGPYYIGGYCFGGLVAFEMAQQLMSGGDTAALVALFSAPLRFNRLVRKHRAAKANPSPQPQTARLSRLLRSPWRALRWRTTALRRRVSSAMDALICHACLAVGLKVPQAQRTMHIVRALSEAERNYVPKPYAGTLTVFRGYGLYEDDPNMGWDGLAGYLDNHEIGDKEVATRRDIMNEPLVQQLGIELAQCTERARAESSKAAVADQDIKPVAAETSVTKAISVPAT